MATREWSDDDFRCAFSAARSWRDLALRLGLSGRSNTRLRGHAVRLGLDITPLDQQVRSRPFSRAARVNDDELSEIVRASLSTSEVARRAGYSAAGGSHAAISRRIKALGLDTSHFDPRANAAPPALRLDAAVILVFDDHLPRRRRASVLRRAMLEMGVVYVCSLCGIEPFWNGQALRLEIDHVDGDWRNNRLVNLRILCPNCHTQTPTYGVSRASAVA